VTNIPPEGDEYNARRQEELHAAVANKATMTRRMAEMIRDNAPADQISQVIEVIAQLDREIPHISKDLAVSVQGRNLSIFLDRMDASLADSRVALTTALEAATLRVLGDVALNLDQITGLVQQGIATGVKALAVAERGIAIGEQALAIATAGEARMAKVETAVGDLRTELIEIERRHGEIEQRYTELAEKLDVYMSGSKRADVETLQIQVRELRGDLSDEQRQRYITILMRMIAEWEAAHPDDVT